MSLYEDIGLKLRELETMNRKLGIVTAKHLREVLPKRVSEQMSMTEIALAAEHLNSMREDLTPVVGTDTKSRAAGEE